MAENKSYRDRESGLNSFDFQPIKLKGHVGKAKKVGPSFSKRLFSLDG